MDFGLSIIAPCFNEEHNVLAFYARVCEVLGSVSGGVNLESLGKRGESGQKMPDSLDSMGGGGDKDSCELALTPIKPPPQIRRI